MNELEKAQMMVGQKQQQLEFMAAEYAKLADLLADLKEGIRTLDQVHVDRLNRTVRWDAIPNPEENGATLNRLSGLSDDSIL